MFCGKVDELMRWGLEEQVFTAGSVLTEERGVVLANDLYGAVGGLGSAPVTPDTLFDLASLTKILATTPGWMMLASRGAEILDRGVSAWFPDAPEAMGEATPRQLLAHSSGLPAWRPFYLFSCASTLRKDFTVYKILSEPPAYPRGTSWIYSDLGFMLLGFILERETGMGLAEFTAREIYRPLGLDGELTFNAANTPRPIVLTRCGDRPGAVHDLNARALGGTAGHAGLFGTASGVAKMMRAVLESSRTDGGFFDRGVTLQFMRRATDIPACTRALGFDTPSDEGSSAGRFFSRESIGHTGFTGTSVWADVKRDLIVVVLTNRVITGESDSRIVEFRPRLHDAVVEELSGGEGSPSLSTEE